jgi:hypothetical protein
VAEPASAVHDRKWRKPALWLGLLAAIVLVGVAGRHFWLRHFEKRDAFYTSSCANHFIQLRLGLSMLAEDNPGLVLPEIADTRHALSLISTNHFGPLDGYNRACPESYLRDESIGYLYVGDGLRLGDVDEKGILIIFCPGENHRGTSDHGHAYAGGEMCVSNEKMIAELERAISRGESGEVAYTGRAMKVLRSELERRRRPAP